MVVGWGGGGGVCGQPVTIYELIFYSKGIIVYFGNKLLLFYYFQYPLAYECLRSRGKVLILPHSLLSNRY